MIGWVGGWLDWRMDDWKGGWMGLLDGWVCGLIIRLVGILAIWWMSVELGAHLLGWITSFGYWLTIDVVLTPLWHVATKLAAKAATTEKISIAPTALCPSIQPSVLRPSCCSCRMSPSSVRRSIHSFLIRPSVYPSFVRSSVLKSVRLFIRHSSVHPTLSQFVCSSVIRPHFVRLSVHLSYVGPSSIRPCI